MSAVAAVVTSVRKLVVLRWRDRLLLAEAVLLLGVAAAMTRLLPFRCVTRAAGWRGRPARLDDAARTTANQGVGWAVVAAARRVPWRAACLQQGLAAQWMLRRRGVPSILYFGGSKSTASGLGGHVWVRDGRVDIVGGQAAARFAVLATFPGSAAPHRHIPRP